jgi:hypothetical protein
MEKGRGFMDVTLARRLVDEMASHAPLAMVPFFRGESLLHPDWFDILQYAQHRNIGEIQFTTNATLLTPHRSDRILDLGLDFISFSLDSLDPASYESSRRGARLSQTLNHIFYFLEKKAAIGAQITVQVSAVETDFNRTDMDAFVDYWRDKVDRVRIYAQHSTDGHPGSLATAMPCFEKRLPCHKPFSDMVIYWSGDVALCNHDWGRTATGPAIGSVCHNHIDAIWNADTYARIRQRHLESDLATVTPCNHCDHWMMYYLPDGFIGRLYQ